MAQRVVLVGQAILDASGYGSCNVIPQGGSLNVTLSSVTVSFPDGSPLAFEPTAKVYLNIVGDAGFVEGTFSGASDSSDSAYIVGNGEILTCVWSGGDPGANATFRVTGTMGG
jgi:hypothetical protein